MVAKAVVASIVLRGRRAALGIATICLIYAITAALIQLGPAPTRWTALLLTHHTVLLLSVLGLWAVGIEKPPPDRPRLAVVLGIGVLAGIAAGPLLARMLPVGLNPHLVCRVGRWSGGYDVCGRRAGETVMASYTVNQAAVARAKRLIDARQYVLDSDWGEAQPRADAENAFLAKHSWDEFAEWHLGLTDGAGEETKARYAFAYGDFRRLHRTGLIACVYRASEWRHKEIELAAHDLLQRLDAATR